MVALLPVGFGYLVAAKRVVALHRADTAPTRRLIQEAAARGLLLDLTSGRRMQSVLVLDTGQVVPLAQAPAVVAEHLASQVTAPGPA